MTNDNPLPCGEDRSTVIFSAGDSPYRGELCREAGSHVECTGCGMHGYIDRQRWFQSPFQLPIQVSCERDLS